MSRTQMLGQGRLVRPSLRHQAGYQRQSTFRSSCVSLHSGTAVPTRPSAKVVDMELVAYDWRARGFTCDLWTDPPSQLWSGLTSQTDGVFMLVSGEVVIELDGQLVRPVAGQEVFLQLSATLSTTSAMGLPVGCMDFTPGIRRQAGWCCPALGSPKDDVRGTKYFYVAWQKNHQALLE
jgi:hypothetical protein